MSTLANAVRIEKLSDDEDEDVDITDDLSDDEEGNKPQAVLSSDFCGPEEKTDSGSQSPTEEHVSLSGVESIHETKEKPSYNSLSPQRLQPSSFPGCSEDPGVTERDEKVNKTASIFPQSCQTSPHTDSKQMFSAGIAQLEEAYSDGMGTSHLLCFVYLPHCHRKN